MQRAAEIRKWQFIFFTENCQGITILCSVDGFCRHPSVLCEMQINKQINKGFGAGWKIRRMQSNGSGQHGSKEVTDVRSTENRDFPRSFMA